MSRTAISITDHRWDAEVRFRYDAQAVAIIKTAPSRTWDAQARTWWIPSPDVHLVARRFSDAGYEVYVNGQPHTTTPRRPPAPAPVDPVAALLAAVPARLRKPTVRALAKVWHPDHGGDPDLQRRLNDAS